MVYGVIDYHIFTQKTPQMHVFEKKNEFQDSSGEFTVIYDSISYRIKKYNFLGQDGAKKILCRIVEFFAISCPNAGWLFVSAIV